MQTLANTTENDFAVNGIH